MVVLAEKCGYTLDRRDAEMVIAAPFMTCGITVKVIFRKDAINDTIEIHFQRLEVQNYVLLMPP